MNAISSDAKVGRPKLQRRYTRAKAGGQFPQVINGTSLEHSRVAMYWRPLIDLQDSAYASDRLKILLRTRHLLDQDEPARALWYSRLGVSGLRQQVLRHAGLDWLHSNDPRDIRDEIGTAEWDELCSDIEAFDAATPDRRAATIFQLSQLSLCGLAVKLHGRSRISSDPPTQRVAYFAARALARLPGGVDSAVSLFDQLSNRTSDRALRLLCKAQAVSLTVRRQGDTDRAAAVTSPGDLDTDSLDSWSEAIAMSRLHRANALTSITTGAIAAMDSDLEKARICQQLSIEWADGIDEQWVTRENGRILLETDMKAGIRLHRDSSWLRRATIDLLREDKNCIDARLLAGDVYFEIADYEDAYGNYARAGEMGTGDGAYGWFRAGQVAQLIGDHDRTILAMSRCLELDASAMEPAEFMNSLTTVVS